MERHEVVVAGGGPVGLMLAGELRLRGTDVVVLERLTAIDRRLKAGAMHGPAAAMLDRRGLGGRLEEVQREILATVGAPPRNRESTEASGPTGPSTLRGHFAGIWALRESAYPSDPLFLIPQDKLEEILAERAAELGADVRRGHALTTYEQDADGATLTIEGPDGTYEIRTGWLVGADGGRSLVRKLAGFAFPGTDGIITGYQGRVELDDPGFAPRGWTRYPGGLLVNGPFPGRVMVVEFDGPPPDRDAEIALEDMQAAVRRVSGTEVTLRSATSLTRFTDNARQADTYRSGRVLLAGDAAHVHSPFGGQGLLLGIGDAANLGWKLALVAAGRAPAPLLDTYTAERHPVAARVLANTRAQVALLRPGPHTDALREIFERLLDHDGANRYLTDMITGSDVRYDLGSADDLVGRCLPSGTSLHDGTRVADLLHDGRALLVTDDPALHEAATPWKDRAGVVSAPGVPYLLRPDGVVAWTADEPTPLPDVLTRWLGPPLPH
ncbi:FAD-dependent monooxygenase [Actinomadura yumaensis]|uniref:FAD-dependent monooxygenase n=1 Tax=Actinomadura yumaensis TaxID=111807 RepID=A0ABW2CT04_9ACTN